MPTRASLAVETKDLLFLWLAYLNNKSNVCKQISPLFDSLVIKLVAAIARFQSYLFLGVRYPEAILVAVLCDLSFAPSDSSFAPSDLLFNLRRAIYRFLRATGLFDPSDLSFAPSDLSFVPSDLSFAPSHSCVRQRMFASQYPGSVLVCTMSVVSGFVEYQDRRSRIKDRGSRIEDRGSRIGD